MINKTKNKEKKRYWDKRLWRWVNLDIPSVKSKLEIDTDWKKFPNNVKLNIAQHIEMKTKKVNQTNHIILYIFCGMLLLGMIVGLLLKFVVK